MQNKTKSHINESHNVKDLGEQLPVLELTLNSLSPTENCGYKELDALTNREKSECPPSKPIIVPTVVVKLQFVFHSQQSNFPFFVCGMYYH